MNNVTGLLVSISRVRAIQLHHHTYYIEAPVHCAYIPKYSLKTLAYHFGVKELREFERLLVII